MKNWKKGTDGIETNILIKNDKFVKKKEMRVEENYSEKLAGSQSVSWLVTSDKNQSSYKKVKNKKLKNI